MHISLDSELGQQRRLNQVGETITSIAAPAAAYSLRSLTGGDPLAVRVRRDSDNTERDFTVSGVNSGAMLSFVNTQTVKPLDVRALESDGDRDGDFQIASAAYSLRSLGNRQATITSHFSFSGADGDSATYNGELFFVSGLKNGKREYCTGDSSTTGACFHYALHSDGNYWVLYDYNIGAVTARSSTDSDNPWEATWAGKGYSPTPDDDDLNNATFSVVNGKYVVQVQRNVNGDKKSFTADEVTDGTLLAFVNESFTSSLPLNTESSAAAAYSLRNLSTSYANGPVINVRRSSDNSTEDFKASEITDGTLLSFVNQIQTVGTAVNCTGGFAYDSFTANGNTGFSADNTGGSTAGAAFPYVFKSGDVIKVSYTVTNFNSDSGLSPSLRGTNAIDNVSSLTSGETPFTANGTYTETLTAAADGTHLMFADAETGSYTISNFKIVSYSSSGFVTTWYDQSGNSKNATQSDTAKQPKIVNEGSVLVDSAGLPEIDFDGTHKLDIDFGADLDQPNSIFMVHQSDTTSANSNEFFDSTGTGGVRSVFDQGSANYRLINHTDSSNVTFEASGSDFAIDTNKNIAVGIFNGTDNSLIAKNGTADTGSTSATNGQNEINRLSTIGLSAPNANNGYDGTMQEFIVYNSDQTENRRALEESISGHYGISLASFNRDGFVRTWYDQSVTGQEENTGTPNAKHATQTSVSNMPTIVSNGSLVPNGIDFDGSNDTLDIPTDLISNINSASAFVVAKSDTTGGDKAGLVLSRNNPEERFYVPFLSSDSGSAKFNFGYKDTKLKIELGSADTNKHIFTGIAGSSNAEGFLDGTSKGTVSSHSGFTALTSGGIASINTGSSFWSGEIEEILVYASDQTANRGAYEGNMADHYGITAESTGGDNVNGFVTKWYDQSGNNRPLIQTTATEQPFIVESGSFLNGVKSNKASSNDTMQNLQVSTDGTTANFGTDDWASGASSKLGLIYVGSVPASLIFKTDSDAVIWGGGRGVSGYQSGGLSLQIVKGGNDSWKLMNEQGIDRMIVTLQTSAQNTDSDVIWYGTADNRDFTVNVNGAGNTDTESADLDTNENAALSLFGAYGGDGTPYYQRSGGGVCKECYLYAGTSITDIPTIATKINEHYSIYT